MHSFFGRPRVTSSFLTINIFLPIFFLIITAFSYILIQVKLASYRTYTTLRNTTIILFCIQLGYFVYYYKLHDILSESVGKAGYLQMSGIASDVRKYKATYGQYPEKVTSMKGYTFFDALAMSLLGIKYVPDNNMSQAKITLNVLRVAYACDLSEKAPFDSDSTNELCFRTISGPPGY